MKYNVQILNARILGLIPARGGSKGLPGKNIKSLGGVPLLGRAILGARKAGCLDRLWVSTDDPAIAAVAESFGVKVPWLRPAELAQDGSLMTDVLAHLLERLQKDEGYRPDAILVLQATSPFRTPETIRRAVELYRKGGGRGVISVTPSRHHPVWSYRIDESGVLRPFVAGDVTPPPRQKLPLAYFLDGSVFLTSTESFLKRRSFYSGEDLALVVEGDEAIDVDTPLDWALAEAAEKARRPEPATASPVFVIAEAGVNHNGELGKALALVDAAADAGADAVKFQTFKAEMLVSRFAARAAYQERNLPDGSTQLEMIRRLELDEAAHRALQARARERGIEFLSTPFDEESLAMLVRLGVPRLKLSSGEVTNKPLLQAAARAGLPLILSTGMSTLEEAGQAVAWVRAAAPACPLTLLHCLTEYPAPPAEVNLRAMRTLRDAFGVPVGYSDHTMGIEVSLAAVALGACLVEKHLTLDRGLPGPDHKASLEPAEFKALVAGVRAVEAALGDGVKRVAPSEAANRAVGRRSVVAARALSAGHVLTAEDIAIKRPGDGIPPAQAEAVLGRALRRPVALDEVLTWEALA